LYGPEFRENWDILIILVSSGVLQAINDVVTQVTASMGKIWWDFCVHLVWGAIIICGSLLAVPKYGVRGYAWTFLAATGVHMVINATLAFLLTKKFMRLSRHSAT